MTIGKGTRKIRSDKKVDCQPTISIELKDVIYRISYVIDTPVKDICEAICIDGMRSRKVLSELSQHFRRTVRLGNTMYMGDINRPSSQRLYPVGKRERIGIRFMAHDFENISSLAFALGVTPSRATALLLDASIRNSDFINTYFERYLTRELDANRMKELKEVIRFLNKNNPYTERISWLALLSFLYTEIRGSASTLNETIAEYIEKWR